MTFLLLIAGSYSKFILTGLLINEMFEPLLKWIQYNNIEGEKSEDQYFKY